MTPLRRGPGRPKKRDDERVTTSIHVKLTAIDYDRLCRLTARAKRPHVTAVARQLLERELQRLLPA
jgi:hypothetical protein